MFDKIRLHAAGRLPAPYVPNLGKGFDGRGCSFLRVDYADLQAQVLAGVDDNAVLAWAWRKSGRRSDEACEV